MPATTKFIVDSVREAAPGEPDLEPTVIDMVDRLVPAA